MGAGRGFVYGGAVSFNGSSLEESALMLTQDVQTFYRVTLKLALRSILSVLLLTFVRAMEEFEILFLIRISGRVLDERNLSETLQRASAV
jgi:ABC-type Fe3+ transport system permease subunit